MKQNVRRVLMTAPILLLLTGCDESIVNAGYNTLLGMGMAFTVLIIISLVISLLSLINKQQEAKAKGTDETDMRRKAVDNAVKQIEQQEQAAAVAAPAASQAGDGGAMLAVFAAAIAAYEADMAQGTGAPAQGAVTAAQAIAPAVPSDLSNWQGIYVRPLRNKSATNWKRA